MNEGSTNNSLTDALFVVVAMLSGTSNNEGKGGNIEILAGASSGNEVDGPAVFLHGGTIYCFVVDGVVCSCLIKVASPYNVRHISREAIRWR